MVAAAVVITSSVVASATDTTPAGPDQPGNQIIRPLAVAAHAPETSYESITPCRIVDTNAAAAGKLVSGARRDFVVSGTTLFVAQGGKSGGCGIPASATAVTASISMTSATGKGYLKAWARGTIEPSATALTFTAGSSAFTGTTIPASATGLSVKPVGGGGRLVVDVTGFFVPPITANITRTGGLASPAPRVTLVEHPSTGTYRVTADRDLTGCAAVATAAGGPYLATAFISSGKVYAETYDTAGLSLDILWQLVVTC
jgi:hypothetical protein